MKAERSWLRLWVSLDKLSWMNIESEQCKATCYCIQYINPLNPELNPICYLLALLANHFLHVTRIRVKSLTLRLLMSYIYIYIYDISNLRVNQQLHSLKYNKI